MNINDLIATLQNNTKHYKDTKSSWDTKFQGKRIKTTDGQDHGTIRVHLDDSDHVVVTVGASTFPVGHLQALVDVGSLSVADS